MNLLLQALIEARQNSPMDELQLLAPHAQAPALADDPLVLRHDAYGLQVLVAAVQ